MVDMSGKEFNHQSLPLLDVLSATRKNTSNSPHCWPKNKNKKCLEVNNGKKKKKRKATFSGFYMFYQNSPNFARRSSGSESTCHGRGYKEMLLINTESVKLFK
jgi:hypothetical protein